MCELLNSFLRAFCEDHGARLSRSLKRQMSFPFAESFVCYDGFDDEDNRSLLRFCVEDNCL